MKRKDALELLLSGINVQIKRREVFAGQYKTHYLIAGKGVPLILVHGGGAGAVQWHQVLAFLAQHFQVIVPDVIGYGESEKPMAPYDRAFFAQ